MLKASMLKIGNAIMGPLFMRFQCALFWLMFCLAAEGASCDYLWAAEKKPLYKDIYLTEDRVCKACTWQWDDQNTNRTYVKLINRQGQATFVRPKDILGVDTHPIIRRLTLKSLHGIGKPGPELVPGAFDNANEIYCKYCDEVGRDGMGK